MGPAAGRMNRIPCCMRIWSPLSGGRIPGIMGCGEPWRGNMWLGDIWAGDIVPGDIVLCAGDIECAGD